MLLPLLDRNNELMFPITTSLCSAVHLIQNVVFIHKHSTFAVHFPLFRSHVISQFCFSLAPCFASRTSENKFFFKNFYPFVCRAFFARFCSRFLNTSSSLKAHFDLIGMLCEQHLFKSLMVMFQRQKNSLHLFNPDSDPGPESMSSMNIHHSKHYRRKRYFDDLITVRQNKGLVFIITSNTRFSFKRPLIAACKEVQQYAG